MRVILALFMAIGLVTAAAVVVPADAVAGTYVVAADQQPTAQLEVDIDTDGGGWWANPVWIGIGVVALIALIAIIMAAARGGTTVVKD